MSYLMFSIFSFFYLGEKHFKIKFIFFLFMQNAKCLTSDKKQSKIYFGYGIC